MTSRLLGEIPTAHHLDDYERLLNDPAVSKTLGGPRSRAQVEQTLQDNIVHWTQHGFGAWVLKDRETGAFVGRGGLKRVRIAEKPETEVLYAFLPDYWGRGLATEMAAEAVRLGFDELGIADIVGFTLVDNLASRRVLEKAGLGYEGPFEHAGFPHVLYRIRSHG